MEQEVADNVLALSIAKKTRHMGHAFQGTSLSPSSVLRNIHSKSIFPSSSGMLTTPSHLQLLETGEEGGVSGAPHTTRPSQRHLALHDTKFVGISTGNHLEITDVGMGMEEDWTDWMPSSTTFTGKPLMEKKTSTHFSNNSLGSVGLELESGLGGGGGGGSGGLSVRSSLQRWIEQYPVIGRVVEGLGTTSKTITTTSNIGNTTKGGGGGGSR